MRSYFGRLVGDSGNFFCLPDIATEHERDWIRPSHYDHTLVEQRFASFDESKTKEAIAQTGRLFSIIQVNQVSKFFTLGALWVNNAFKIDNEVFAKKYTAGNPLLSKRVSNLFTQKIKM